MWAIARQVQTPDQSPSHHLALGTTIHGMPDKTFGAGKNVDARSKIGADLGRTSGMRLPTGASELDYRRPSIPPPRIRNRRYE